MKKFLFLILLVSIIAIAETVISPNMNLPVPVVGTTPGPDWANNINSCMTTIDQHDHTPGNGVQISSSALDITSDLPLSNNSLTQVESVVFTAQSSLSTRQAVYVISPDLIYNDGNGNTIRITQSGSVAGASGTITGLPSGTASAAYQSVGGTFQFQSATNTPANGSFASVLIAQQTTSPNTITLKSPNSLASSYNVTFPTATPSFTSLLTMSTSGVLSTVGYKVPSVQKFTSGSGTYTLPTAPSPIYIRVILVGGGGGGGGAEGSAATGSTGSNTTFGSNTAAGGTGGAAGAGGASGTGGTGTLAAGFSGIASSGGAGGAASNVSTVAAGAGGSSAIGGGAPSSGSGGNNGTDAVANTGGGGSGASGASSTLGSAGGGGGGYVNAINNAPASNYSYAVGAGGAGGTGGKTGGAGGSGVIVVEEYYQ